MLEIAFNDPDGNGLYKNLILVIDAHTHLGKEAIITTKGKNIRQNTILDTIDMYNRVGTEIRNFNSEETPFTITTSSFYGNIQKSNEILSPLEKSLKNGEVIDAIVVFPFSDTLKDKTKPSFRQTNDFLLSRCYSIENSIRTFPYCRVDPKDGELACEELHRAAESGAQGLKLHPLSQHFTDKINSTEVENILITAAKLNLPIIFDTANANIAEDIVTVSTTSYDKLKEDNRETQLKVILGHLAFDYSNKKIADFLKLPYIYGETSGCRGEDVELLFKNLIKSFDDNSWSNKLLFGSDANYFGWLQVLDFWKYLLSDKWWEGLKNNDRGEIIEIIRRILGGNQLNLLKPLSVGQEVRLNIRKEDSYDKITFALNLPLFNKIYKETSFVPIIDQVNFFYSQKKVSDTENEEESFQDIIIPGMKINFISSKVIKKEKRLQKSSLEMDLIHLDNECLSNFKKKDLKKKDYLQYFNPSKELLSEEE
jgi:predicted TIM-barrel fold metal-dependent hydrolase